MQHSEILTEQIDRAASTINMLSAEDFSEIEQLQEILDQINNTLSQINDGPTEFLEQARGATSDSIELLGKIIRKEVEDTDKSIEAVSRAVTTVQNLIDQICGNCPATKCQMVPKQEQNVTEELPRETPVIMEEDVPLILDFITESCEHLESAEAGLLELENKPDDKDVINQIFRGFHTIKGMAGFLNLTDIGSLAHSAENLLGLVREGQLVFTGDNIDVTFESIDMMKKMIVLLKDSVESGSPVPFEERLPQLLAKLKASAESEPAAKQDDTEQAENKAEEVKKEDIGIKESADSSNSDASSEQDEKIESVLDAKNNPQTNTPVKSKTHSEDEKIKVSTARLDNLINMVGELVIAQLMVSEEVSNNLSSEHQLSYKVSSQSKLVRELQELSMSMRMVPIGGVFQKMTRLVRDLSHKADKNIDFVTVGDETELDRSIVDKIADPLVHMIRNSVDHGIESSDDRVKSGKTPKGRLELRAFHQAGNIVIEIQDDGKGLDKERILKKAVDNGIIEAGQELSDEEIYKLIFHAGLSTAQKVTSISGRGVGMDVVRKNIESLNGKIEIQSSPGKGTTFTIRMPLTLAIIDGQVVKVGDERYIIPINSIINSFRPTASQISTVQNKGEMVLVRGELLPLIRLYKLFGVAPISEEPSESLLVIVEKDSEKYCLLVDELLDQQQVVIKSLNKGLGKVKGITGAAIMGDGKVSLILDIPGLVELTNSKGLPTN